MAKSMIAATVIPPKVYFDSKSVQGAILAELTNKQVPELRKTFEITTRTWRHKPFFQAQFFFAGGDVRVYMFTFDKIWNWLEEGTSVRYASMQEGFIRKTHPGRLYPRPGKLPDPAFVSRKFPHKGIEPRNWRPLITHNIRISFVTGIQGAVTRAVARTKKTP